MKINTKKMFGVLSFAICWNGIKTQEKTVYIGCKKNLWAKQVENSFDNREKLK